MYPKFLKIKLKKIGNNQFEFKNISVPVSSWMDFLFNHILPACSIWDEFCSNYILEYSTDVDKNPKPLIIQASYASHWSSKEGGTRLAKNAMQETKVKDFLKYFSTSSSQKKLWIVLELKDPMINTEKNELSAMIHQSSPLKRRNRSISFDDFDSAIASASRKWKDTKMKSKIKQEKPNLKRQCSEPIIKKENNMVSILISIQI